MLGECAVADRRGWGVGIGIQTTLLAIAAVDLARRPAAAVNGRKPWWGLGLLVQPIGPIAYLLRGRRPG